LITKAGCDISQLPEQSEKQPITRSEEKKDVASQPTQAEDTTPTEANLVFPSGE
jgi:hypothetical protein